MKFDTCNVCILVAFLLLAKSEVCAQTVVQGFDFEAVEHAVNTAGWGGSIEFPAGIYEIENTVNPKPGQTLFSNGGAVFHRPSPPETILVSDVLPGDDFVEVQNPDLFNVGDFITPVGVGGGDDDVEPANRRVISIDGNRLYTHKDFVGSYAIGTIVTKHYHMIQSNHPFYVDGLIFDGNRDNQLFVSWKYNRAIQGFEGIEVKNCFFEELSGDGVGAFGGASVFTNNTFCDSDSAAFHLSNDEVEDDNLFICENTFVRTNQRHELAGHSEGAITISLRVNHVRVYRNYAEDIPVAFIGDFHVDMRDWRVKFNEVHYCAAGLFSSKLNNNGPGPLSSILFRHNRVFNCGTSTMHVLWPAESLRIRENTFSDSPVQLIDVNGTVDDNDFASCGGETYSEVGVNSVAFLGNRIHDAYCGRTAANSQTAVIGHHVSGDISSLATVNDVFMQYSGSQSDNELSQVEVLFHGNLKISHPHSLNLKVRSRVSNGSGRLFVDFWNFKHDRWDTHDDVLELDSDFLRRTYDIATPLNYVDRTNGSRGNVLARLRFEEQPNAGSANATLTVDIDQVLWRTDQ